MMLGCTETMIETQTEGPQEELQFSQPEEAAFGPKWTLCLQQKEDLTLGVPMDLVVKHCEEDGSVFYNLSKTLNTVCT